MEQGPKVANLACLKQARHLLKVQVYQCYRFFWNNLRITRFFSCSSLQTSQGKIQLARIELREFKTFNASSRGSLVLAIDRGNPLNLEARISMSGISHLTVVHFWVPNSRCTWTVFFRPDDQVGFLQSCMKPDTLSH